MPKSMRSLPSSVLQIYALFLICLLACQAAAAEAPGDTLIAPLEELWRFGDDAEQLLGFVRDIEVDPNGDVYILDRQLSRVQVISHEGGFLGSIGGEGDGPGEFRRAEDLVITPAGLLGVLEAMPGRITLLSREGESRGDLSLPPGREGGTLVLQSARCGGGNLVIYHFERDFQEEHVDQRIFLQAVDGEGQAGVIYAEMFVRDIPNRMVVDETERGPVLQRWQVGPDGRVWLAEGYSDYRIKVWHPAGPLDMVIEKDLEPLPRDDPRKAQLEEEIRRAMRDWPGEVEIRVNDHEIAIVDFQVMPGGDCWVLNSRGSRAPGPGRLAVYDVFDSRGHFRHHLEIIWKGQPEPERFFLRGGRLFTIQADANDGSIELVCHQIGSGG